MRCTKTNQAISEQKDYVSYGGVILPAPLKPILGSRSVSLDLLGWKFLQLLPTTEENSKQFNSFWKYPLTRLWGVLSCAEFYCILKKLPPCYFDWCTLNQTGVFAALFQIPWGPDWANILDNVVCTHVQEGARQIKSTVSDLKQPYPYTWSALTAQCEILEKLDTSLQPWHPTCTTMLTQQSSLCLINLDSSVGITVWYSADTFQDISGVLGTKWLCQGGKKKKKALPCLGILFLPQIFMRDIAKEQNLLSINS